MSRQVMDLEDELARLWGLVGELTDQARKNRQLLQSCMDKAGNVKGQAVHAGAGFPLRRFNLDISDEQFHTELEAFASHLVLENQQLQQENKQLNTLLKEYEGTMETVMGKFRGAAHASQQHDLSLHSYYTSLLQTLQTAHSSAHLHDDTSLSLLLTRLSTLLRSALRSLGGEEAEVDLVGLIQSELSNGHAAFSDGSSPPPSPTKSSSSGKKSVIQTAPARQTPFPGSVPGSSGGYSGTNGQADWALEREMEILRLEEENKSLREMLAIAEESPAVQAIIEEVKDVSGPSTPDGLPGERRKSSLTIEELEAGAELEEQARERGEGQTGYQEDEIERGMTFNLAGMHPRQPGTGLGGGMGPQEGQQRPNSPESVLGFSAQGAPEEAIDDGPES